jgi:twinkle protein
MEESGNFVPVQHNEDGIVEQSFRPANISESLMPLAHLPRKYRAAIDKGFSTGWKCLDKYLQGLRPGEVTIVTADTGAGKTTFCTQLMVNCAMQGIPVWINSWEMRPEVVMRKLASIVLRRPMKLHDFSEHENEQFDEWSSRNKVYVNPNTIGTNIESFAILLKKAQEIGVKVVMLDHLDYLVNFTKEKMSEAIDATVKRLHELAFSLGMHFILICHPRQSNTSGEEVGMHSLKGSSSIKQYADNIIILHRCKRSDPTEKHNRVKVKVAKNRMFGTEGYTYLFYEEEWDGYMEIAL